jgi:hypothetical protein
MKNGFYFGFIFLIASLGACSPVRVFLEKNEVSSVKEYKSFMVINEYYGKNAYGSPELEENLQLNLIKGLEDRGLELDIHNPDLIVRYNTILSQNQKEVNTMPHNPYGWGMYNPWMWRYPYYYGQRNTYKIEKYNLGEVVMDFIDAKKDEAILRISAVGEVNKPEQMSKNIRVSVDKILSEFSKRING